MYRIAENQSSEIQQDLHIPIRKLPADFGGLFVMAPLKMGGPWPNPGTQIDNYGKSPCFSWENSLFLRSIFNSYVSHYQRVYGIGFRWVCLKIVYPIVPNGFHDHDPVFKWLFHWEDTQHFQTNPDSPSKWHTAH